ncbi:MAG: DUF4129 domain-containing transglutaminase family protein [Candidatus Dormibacteraceae bacterium]
MLRPWPERAAGRLGRLPLPSGWAPSLLLALLLILALGNSTVAAQWVPGSAPIRNVALLGGIVGAALALAGRVRWPVALAVAFVAGAVVAYWTAAPVGVHIYPYDAAGRQALQAWNQQLLAGDPTQPSVFLFLLCLLAWLTGGWLLWSTLRSQKPLLGMIPVGVGLATNVLNYPDQQGGYVFAFIVLLSALLLWTNYRRSLDTAHGIGVGALGDFRWSFWKTGAGITATVLVLGILAPPLSSTDRSIDLESGIFKGWASLIASLNHPAEPGIGGIPSESIGFATSIQLNGPLRRTGAVVFTYKLPASFAGPHYFRGLNMSVPVDGLWSGAGLSKRVQVPKSKPVAYVDHYPASTTATFKIDMLRPPASAPDVLFYPGHLVRTDRATDAEQGLPWPVSSPGTLETVDELSTASGTAQGRYAVTVNFLDPTVPDLESDSGPYPSWALTYLTTESTNPLALATAARIRQLALQVTAADTNAYDRAVDIQNYLRRFTYTLTPPATPVGQDPLAYFLFDSQMGYCAYFATAMGDMLLSLGIPTRLVNGYGPGTYDARLQQYVVRESDAHSWVEAFFPNYGWIPFEPTPQSGYGPITRHPDQSAACPGGRGCLSALAPPPATGQTLPSSPHGNRASGTQALDAGAIQVGGLRVPTAPWEPPVALLVVLLAALILATKRYLTPRSAGGAWGRAVGLARLAGLTGAAGDSPRETGKRVAAQFHELGPDFQRLSDRFAVAAYAPPALASAARADVIGAWKRVRPALLRRVARRFKLGRQW